jgi:tetratricopeptide (TPR) repeat protein
VEPTNPQLEQGRAAYERRSWRAAHDALEAAHALEPLALPDLWRLAVASFLVGREDDFTRALQDGYQTSMDAHQPLPAARYAVWLGLHLVNRGEPAQATGWFGRAARLLEQADGDCAERGYVLLPLAFQRLGAGDVVVAARTAGEAAAIGHRFGDGDLLALALHIQGRALLRQSRVEEGLALLDEAMVAAAAGELSPHVTGLIYCGVISACRRGLRPGSRSRMDRRAHGMVRAPA